MKPLRKENDPHTNADITSSYLESIKRNYAALRQFFTEMPKGGDVHNHLTGSAYAETYFELAAKKICTLIWKQASFMLKSRWI